MFTRTTPSIGLTAELQSAEAMDVTLYRRANDRIRWTREMLARPNGPGPVAMVKKMGTAAGQFFRSTDVCCSFVASANKADGNSSALPAYLPAGYTLKINADDSAELVAATAADGGYGENVGAGKASVNVAA